MVGRRTGKGHRFSINGTKGRLEIAEYHSGMKVAEPALYINFYAGAISVLTGIAANKSIKENK